MLTILLEVFAKCYGNMEVEDIKFSLVSQELLY